MNPSILQAGYTPRAISVSAQVRIRALRPFRVRQDAFAVGAVVALAPLDAASCLGTGRAVLVDPADLAVITAAVAAQAALACRDAERSARRFVA